MANKVKTSRWFGFLVSFVMLLLCSKHVSLCNASSDTLRLGDSLRNKETLVSAGGLFELGFFDTGGPSSDHYLGIWFKNDTHKKPVWVANRENPILGESGIFTIRYDGNMVIMDIRQIAMIVNYGVVATSSSTRAKILDSGNLILLMQQQEEEKIIWQSFDYPTDTFLPGMKLGWFNIDTNHTRMQILVSWLSPIVPSIGAFALGLDGDHNRTRFNVWHGEVPLQHIGFWDGHSFRFFFQSASDAYNFSFVSNSKDIYITFDNKGENISWFTLTSTGEINKYTMSEEGISIINHTICEGITVENPEGCLVPSTSMCGGDDDNFSEISGSMPDPVVVSSSIRLEPGGCEIMCRSNCSCTAYASFRDDGSGCALYYGDRRDLLRIINRGNGIVYVRGHLPTNSDLQRKWRLILAFTISGVFLATMVILISLHFHLRQRRKRAVGMSGSEEDATRESASLLLFQFGTNVEAISESSSGDGLELRNWKDHDLPLLSFSAIVTATDNFSAENKIGEGGFGPVYKGKLLGHEIAVKRLSRMSGQGLEEFKNEVRLISKLQHSNLVRLLGYCIQSDEKILIYEYMPNSSLDSFIFDANKRTLLDWPHRVQIMEGVAQGLLYLHKYSRVKIIHRDLKTSNILLDGYMNPKISDFGMARIFDAESSHAKTRRVVGTYGYMSPEYVVRGIFSTKSDVFSFGVIMLEIISGRKNTTFYESERSLNLLGYAWEMWKDGRCLELMDPTLAEDSHLADNDRLTLCIQVALLCIQENAKDRPAMLDVVSMLSNERMSLPVPKQPAFSTYSGVMDVGDDENEQPPPSNGVTFSAVVGR